MNRRQFFAALGISTATLALMHAFPAPAEARYGDGTGPDGRGPRNGAPCDTNAPARRAPRNGRGYGRGPNGARPDAPRGAGPGNGLRDGSGPRRAPQPDRNPF